MIMIMMMNARMNDDVENGDDDDGDEEFSYEWE